MLYIPTLDKQETECCVVEEEFDFYRNMADLEQEYQLNKMRLQEYHANRMAEILQSSTVTA